MNFVQFGATVSSWKSKLQKIETRSSELLDDLVDWIRGLRCQGSTNTLAAIEYALNDEGTEAVYLLTDGRPDQPPDAVFRLGREQRWISYGNSSNRQLLTQVCHVSCTLASLVTFSAFDSNASNSTFLLIFPSSPNSPFSPRTPGVVQRDLSSKSASDPYDLLQLRR